VNRNDAQLFAALVHACRYAGLNAASLAAHDEARRLDPTVPTSFEYSLLAAGQFDRVAELDGMPNIDTGGLLAVLVFDPENAAGIAALRMLDSQRLPHGVRLIFDAIAGTVRGSSVEAARKTIDEMMTDGPLGGGPRGDPEALFLCAALAARIGDRDRALNLLEQTVTGGFWPVQSLETAALFAPLRSNPRFAGALDNARRRREVAAAIFERNGGGTLLGLPPGAA
jgi:hypothetical protein